MPLFAFPSSLSARTRAEPGVGADTTGEETWAVCCGHGGGAHCSFVGEHCTLQNPVLFINPEIHIFPKF